VGSRLRLRMDSRGKLDRLLDYEAWNIRMLGDSPEMARQLFAQTFNEEYFRQLVEFGTGLPGRGVAVGARWPVKQEVSGGAVGKLKLDLQNTLRGYEEQDRVRCAAIATQGSVSSGEGEAGTGGQLAVESGTTTGTLWLDPARGRMVRSVSAVNLRLLGRFPGDGNTTFQVDYQQSATLELVESGKARN